MKRMLVYLFFAAALIPAFQPFAVSEALSAESAESWKDEFNSVCGQTDNAAEMTAEDLRKAISRCDALKPKVEALEATPRKVYLKRLQMCRNLFVYLLEGKDKKSDFTPASKLK